MKVNGMTTSPNGQLVLFASASGKLQIRKSSDMVSVVYCFKYVKYCDFLKVASWSRGMILA